MTGQPPPGPPDGGLRRRSGSTQALPFTLEYEGGFVDDPDDPGGRTNKGITQKTYDAWQDSAGRPKADVFHITDAEVGAIYHQRYWVDGKCEPLPWPVSMVHFDACVNHGLKNAAKLLQRAAGVTDDGAIGPMTLQAVGNRPALRLAERTLWARLDFYEAITDRRGTLRKFLRGWLKRVLKLRRELEGAQP